MNKILFLPQTGTLKIKYDTEKTVEVVKKVSLFSAVFVDTPFHSKLFSQLETLRLQGLENAERTHRALRCLAPPATGKTSIAIRYAERTNSRVLPGEMRIPVLYVTLQNASTPRKLMSTMLDALGDIASGKGSEHLLKRRLRQLLRLYKVELIIVDEVHHLAQRRNISEVVNALKAFLNDRICPLAFLGTGDALRLFTANHELGQRIATIADISPLPQNAQGRAFMAKFLVELNRELIKLNIFRENSNFVDDRAVGAIHKVSNGVMGCAARILQYALEVAIRRGASRIELYDVCAAIDGWAIPQGFCRSNPLKEG